MLPADIGPDVAAYLIKYGNNHVYYLLLLLLYKLLMKFNKSQYKCIPLYFDSILHFCRFEINVLMLLVCSSGKDDTVYL